MTIKYVCKSPTVKNCAFCANKPLILAGSFLGYCCFSFRCDHEGKNCNINISLVYIVISVISAALIFLKAVYKVVEDGILKSNQSFVYLLKLSSDGLTATTCILFIICNILNTKERMRFYKGITSILKKSEEYHMEDLLNTTVVGKLRRKSLCCVIIVTLNAVLYSVILNKYTDILSTYTYILMGFCYTSDMVMHREMLLSCYGYLKRSLNQKLKHCNSDSSLLLIIRDVQRLHSSVIYNFEIFNEFVLMPLIIGLLFTMSVTIIYTFILIVRFSSEEDQLTVWEYVDVVIMFGFVFIPGAYNVLVVEELKNSSNDLLSFIFRYPITKLSAEEAAQVELLITTLTIQKPILRASNIFTVGTKLLASISGTVVTYLLVALQFHLSWSKKKNISENQALQYGN